MNFERACMSLLKQNTKIGIITPSVSLSGKKDLSKGLEYVQSLGFELILGQHVFDNEKFHPKTEIERAQDIMMCFKNPDIKAIFCTTGGIGSQRMLDHLDFEVIKNNPKPIFGISDNTALQLGIYAKTGNPFVVGFSPQYDTKDGTIAPFTEASLLAALKGEKFFAKSGQTMNVGKGEGVLLGECLSMMSQLSGTKYAPDYTDKILLIEDECEKPYKIHMMLTQLKQNPTFGDVKGIVFGAFTECEYPESASHGTIEDVLNEFASSISIPVIKDFQFGHIKDRYVIPMGVKYRLDANNCTLEEV